MSERLNRCLEVMRNSGRTGIIPYVTIGFPNLEDTLSIVSALEQAGATAVELGIPYSDPLAEGPTIQEASYHALEQGVTVRDCIEAVRELRRRGVSIPLIFMGYYNPIVNYGLEEYAVVCRDAGVDGFIVPDLPVDEATPFHVAVSKVGLALIPLLAPTSTKTRITSGCAQAQGFVYCVSVAGVTGARMSLPLALPDLVNQIREHTSLPIAVGFGVSNSDHVRSIGQVADAAVVGSALINVIKSSPSGERAARAGAFVADLLRYDK